MYVGWAESYIRKLNFCHIILAREIYFTNILVLTLRERETYRFKMRRFLSIFLIYSIFHSRRHLLSVISFFHIQEKEFAQIDYYYNWKHFEMPFFLFYLLSLIIAHDLFDFEMSLLFFYCITTRKYLVGEIYWNLISSNVDRFFHSLLTDKNFIILVFYFFNKIYAQFNTLNFIFHFLFYISLFELSQNNTNFFCFLFIKSVWKFL